jgi:hypothetical protein
MSGKIRDNEINDYSVARYRSNVRLQKVAKESLAIPHQKDSTKAQNSMRSGRVLFSGYANKHLP